LSTRELNLVSHRYLMHDGVARFLRRCSTRTRQVKVLSPLWTATVLMRAISPCRETENFSQRASSNPTEIGPLEMFSTTPERARSFSTIRFSVTSKLEAGGSRRSGERVDR
jgi:hypothetical protein